MITYNDFAHPRSGQQLGNHLFELASLTGLARRYGTGLYLPRRWPHADGFALTPSLRFGGEPAYVALREPSFACSLAFFDRFAALVRRENVSVEGYLQSEKYWKPAEAEVRRMLAPSATAAAEARAFATARGIDTERSVAISVRRGDFATDPGHYLLPASYYAGAYRRHFDGRPAVVFSDDIGWCRTHLGGLAPAMHFADGLTPAAQLALMGRCHRFVIANSTFSWWGAYLARPEGKTVVRPRHHFDGPLRHTDLSDHYPAEWLAAGD